MLLQIPKENLPGNLTMKEKLQNICIYIFFFFISIIGDTGCVSVLKCNILRLNRLIDVDVYSDLTDFMIRLKRLNN